MPKKIYPVTIYISNDEPCALMREFYRGNTRLREFTVVRNDALAKYTEKIGTKAEWGTTPLLNIMGADPESNEIYETVGSMRDIANQRHYQGYSDDAYDVDPGMTPQQWVDSYHEERERRESLVRNN